ncbi:MAG: hypothetical protein JXQ73_15450 [Phycisphaerae bacterium]|nr:hypothetical protein [Phycisphaerae bacterium]
MSIFAKIRLRPTQLRTVADRRFDDADALRRTRKNARANGAMYLGGFAVECLLKAKLLEKFAWLQSTGSSEGLSRDDRRLWSLCYRSHELDAILAKLPEVRDRVSRMEQRGSNRLSQALKSICASWTVYARYSPSSADMDEAEGFLEQIKELMPWLK